MGGGLERTAEGTDIGTRGANSRVTGANQPFRKKGVEGGGCACMSGSVCVCINL